MAIKIGKLQKTRRLSPAGQSSGPPVSRNLHSQTAIIGRRRFEFYSIRSMDYGASNKIDETAALSPEGNPSAFAALVQGSNARKAFQSPNVFPRNGVESLVNAAHRAISPAQFSKIELRTGGGHLDWACLISCPIQ